MNVAEFILKHKPSFKACQVKDRLGSHQFPRDANHWFCTLSTDRYGFTFYYSGGNAITTALVSDVLECLVGDCRVGGMYYDEALSDFGELDEYVWKECVYTRGELLEVLGEEGLNDLLSIEF